MSIGRQPWWQKGRQNKKVITIEKDRKDKRERLAPVKWAKRFGSRFKKISGWVKWQKFYNLTLKSQPTMTYNRWLRTFDPKKCLYLMRNVTAPLQETWETCRKYLCDHVEVMSYALCLYFGQFRCASNFDSLSVTHDPVHQKQRKLPPSLDNTEFRRRFQAVPSWICFLYKSESDCVMSAEAECQFLWGVKVTNYPNWKRMALTYLKMKMNNTKRPKNTVTLSIVRSITTSW